MSFAPYQPPPGVPADDSDVPSSSKKAKKPWFGRDASFLSGSYQGGGVGESSAAATSYSSNAGAVESGFMGDDTGTGNSWETRFGFRVDIEAAASYILGPVTAFLLLILETTNDYVRFHAYQSALLTTPMLLLHLFFSFIFPRWLRWIYFILELGVIGFMAFKAYTGADQGLSRFYLPTIGDLAERWVSTE